MLGKNRRSLTVAGKFIFKRMSAPPDRVKGRMFSVQDSLPRLPVPLLNQTLDKYLHSVKPLLTEEDFQETKKVVEEFRKGIGPQLQKSLEERSRKEENWLSEWWKQEAYLKLRSPVVINSNPGILFPPQQYKTKDEQLRFAAQLIAGLVDYKIMIDKRSLPVDMLGGKPLCMMQYYEILSGCRIPDIKRDTHVCYPPTVPHPPHHINIIHNNHIFSLEVFGAGGKPLNRDQLYQQLQEVVEQSAAPTDPLGLLTMQDRTSWAKIYNTLSKDKQNAAHLDNINRSIVTVSLDTLRGSSSEKYNCQNFNAAIMLHGGGPELHSGNRWFDKTLTLIISPEGACGMNYEHTTAEGPPIATLLDYILDFCQDKKDFPSPASGIQKPRRLDFRLDDHILSAINSSKTICESMTKDIELTVFNFKQYGKNLPKSAKLSPDAYIQMALQLAYYKLYKKPTATYETGSLRQFHLGRTDTIRSCSVDSHNFTKAMEDQSKSDTERVELLKKAIAAHRKYTDDAVSGQAIDRHLLGLKLTALEQGLDLPALFMDYGYATSTHYRMSTSQVAAKHAAVLCFGPVVPDGYGICYNPQENHITFTVSAFNVCPETNSRNFVASLEQSLLDMQKIVAPKSKL